MRSHDPSELLLRLLSAPRRNHFFYGKRMDVQHFQMEQDYGKNKQWLLNRLTLGKGVLCGLQVSIDDNKLCVTPGVAIDGLGREIVVPVRACIDPTAEHAGCCGGETHTTYPRPTPDAGTHVPADPAGRGVFTLWLCYNECHTDQQPVLVTDCDTRSQCAPGTVVETFCLTVTPGMPPPQGDPDWCLNWAKSGKPADDGPDQPSVSHLTHTGSAVAVPERPDMTEAAMRAAQHSRRHALCTLLDGNCDPAESDPCVPLAVGLLSDNRIVAMESCLVRPRVYSNAVLLDLILCLAQRVEECCTGEEPPPPPPPPVRELLRVQGVSFLSRNVDGAVTEVASVASPLDEITVKISQRANAIRVRFTGDFAQNAHIPTTHGPNDGDFKRHNVQVLPGDPLNGLEYVPGTLAFEDARTIRFDLHPESPYVRGERGWQKGRYRLALFGHDNLAANRRGITDTAGSALDGEPAAPANGAISGDNTPGGNFELKFIIG